MSERIVLRSRRTPYPQRDIVSRRCNFHDFWVSRRDMRDCGESFSSGNSTSKASRPVTRFVRFASPISMCRSTICSSEKCFFSSAKSASQGTYNN